MVVDILNRIYEDGVISILRGIPKEGLEKTLDALYIGGVRCIEITMNSKNAINTIEWVKEHYDDKFMIGAGTVLDDITARNVIIAGADFVLAPTMDVKTIEICNTYDKLAVPGAFTPTEILAARKAGALLIKVFPMSSVGPAYIKDILGPLNDLNLLPVGGVTIENSGEYIKAGAFAVGIGSSLVNKKDIDAENFKEIEKRAKNAVALVRSNRK